MRGEVTITDDDATPTPTLTNPSMLEGNSATTDLIFEATLAAPHPALTFNFRTVTDTANTSDFDAAAGSKLFPRIHPRRLARSRRYRSQSRSGVTSSTSSTRP